VQGSSSHVTRTCQQLEAPGAEFRETKQVTTLLICVRDSYRTPPTPAHPTVVFWVGGCNRRHLCSTLYHLSQTPAPPPHAHPSESVPSSMHRRVRPRRVMPSGSGPAPSSASVYTQRQVSTCLRCGSHSSQVRLRIPDAVKFCSPVPRPRVTYKYRPPARAFASPPPVSSHRWPSALHCSA
jgi:hypothetical protein